MKRTLVLFTILILVVSCGGGGGDSADQGGDQDSTQSEGGDGDLADPCQLLDQATLDAYFSEPVEDEASGSGSFLSCTWSDSNANAVIVSVAASDTVNRPDVCPDCIDLGFADDGYATSVPLQSSAEFVVGNHWYGVSTTGLGDDVNSIAALARQVKEVAEGP